MHNEIASQECFTEDIHKAIKEGFKSIDKKYREKLEDDGTTAVVAIIQGGKIYVGNAGDSRCISSNKERKAVPLSVDHKPNLDTEKKRIEAADFEVNKETIVMHGKRTIIWRIDGKIAVSRGIGDDSFKDEDLEQEKQAVSPVPDVTEVPIEDVAFLVLACDGLWDVVENQETVDFVWKGLQNNEDLNSIAKGLADLALSKSSDDNITVIIVLFE